MALLAAQLVADFGIPRAIPAKRHLIWKIMLHAAVAASVSWVFLGNLHWQTLVAIAMTHILSDIVVPREVPARPFLLDQALHFAVLIALSCYFPDTASQGWWPAILDLTQLAWFNATLCLTAGVLLVVPAGGVLIGKLTQPIREQIENEPRESNSLEAGAERDDDEMPDGLENGGKYIGWLERFLTMLLILINQPTGIGFLITAKSILRFGEIKESKHRKIAEYVIIGTFLSFGWALLISVLLQKGIEYWTPKSEEPPDQVRVILE